MVEPMLPRLTWRTLVSTAVLLFLLGADLGTAPRAITIAVGPVSATETELSECYFNIHGAMLALHPRGEPCQMVKEFVGRGATLVLVLD